MTMAISMAAQEGAKAVICASTGNTSASAAAYAVRADMVCAVLVPAGKIAMGKLAQALVHGARLLQVDGNFDDCLTLARELSEDYPVALVNSVNPARIEGQKTTSFEIVDQLGKAPTSTACRSATPGTSPPIGWDTRSTRSNPGCGDSRQPVPPRSCAARPCATPRRSLPPSGSEIPPRGSRPRRPATTPAA